jgi:hypothetical protein
VNQVVGESSGRGRLHDELSCPKLSKCPHIYKRRRLAANTAKRDPLMAMVTLAALPLAGMGW